jgi:hypothetical protein
MPQYIECEIEISNIEADTIEEASAVLKVVTDALINSDNFACNTVLEVAGEDWGSRPPLWRARITPAAKNPEVLKGLDG